MSPPGLSTKEVAEACVVGGSKPLDAKVLAAIGSLEQNAERLRTSVAAGSCWALTSEDFPLTVIAPVDVKEVYDTRLVRGRGRGAYDKILSSAMMHRCPYCGLGSVSTLDHFLPKSGFGALAIEPWNLIPCCKDCNHAMGAESASCEEQEFIHPYHWRDEVSWLGATVVAVDEPFAQFFPMPPECSLYGSRAQISHHFARLKLHIRYAEASAGAIHETTHAVQHLRSQGDPTRIRDYIRELAESMVRAAGPNYWRVALYRALGDCEWYWGDWVWR